MSYSSPQHIEFAECDAYQSGQRFLDSSDPRLTRHVVSCDAAGGGMEPLPAGKDEKLSRLDFIKIDVEGAEHKVLSGGRELISRFKPVIMLELLDSALNKQGSSAKEVVSLLNDMGYLIYDFSPKTGRLAESDLKAHSDNIVASPAPLASS